MDAEYWWFSELTIGTAIHEIMHALGWDHTHQRPDRDSYVTIHEANIEAGQQSQFSKISEIGSPLYQQVQKGQLYDYDSIMHYPKKAFSKNGKATITTKNSLYDNKIGQRDGLSRRDIEEIQQYYFGTN